MTQNIIWWIEGNIQEVHSMVLSLPLLGKSCIISLLSPLFSVTKKRKKKSSFPFMSVKGKIQEDRPGFIIPIPLKKISREILYVLLGEGTDFPSRRQNWTVFLWTVVGNHFTDSCNSFDPPRAKSKLCLHQWPRGDAGEPFPFPFPSLFFMLSYMHALKIRNTIYVHNT